MSYTIKGNIIEIYPSEEISEGKYRKQQFVLENTETYEHQGEQRSKDSQYIFEIFEKSDLDRIEKFNKFNKVGSSVEVSFNVSCRPNANNPGKWFTTLSAFKVWGDKASVPADSPIDEEPPF